mmetsp:Transcript_17664/g.26139  ORF Transcript_17664/g.26139 Transcript_17664/m.26139 type:complete len:218 (+) Transcript_17664:1523-2176(+)
MNLIIISIIISIAVIVTIQITQIVIGYSVRTTDGCVRSNVNAIAIIIIVIIVIIGVIIIRTSLVQYQTLVVVVQTSITLLTGTTTGAFQIVRVRVRYTTAVRITTTNEWFVQTTHVFVDSTFFIIHRWFFGTLEFIIGIGNSSTIINIIIIFIIIIAGSLARQFDSNCSSSTVIFTLQRTGVLVRFTVGTTDGIVLFGMDAVVDITIIIVVRWTSHD